EELKRAEAGLHHVRHRDAPGDFRRVLVLRGRLRLQWLRIAKRTADQDAASEHCKHGYDCRSLHAHGLLQSGSRTRRTINSIVSAHLLHFPELDNDWVRLLVLLTV